MRVRRGRRPVTRPGPALAAAAALVAVVAAAALVAVVASAVVAAGAGPGLPDASPADRLPRLAMPRRRRPRPRRPPLPRRRDPRPCRRPPRPGRPVRRRARRPLQPARPAPWPARPQRAAGRPVRRPGPAPVRRPIPGQFGHCHRVAGVTSDERWLAAVWPFVRDRLPAPPGGVVEIGCGPLGGFVPRLRSAGYDATGADPEAPAGPWYRQVDRKSTRLNSSHVEISYAVFCLKKKKKK